MLQPFLAILPVVALIATGYALRRGGFPGEGFWRPAARLVYFVFLPALLVRLVALAELDGALWRAQAAAGVAVLVITGVLLLSRKPLGLASPAFTSVVQGSIRHNTYIGLAIGAVVLSDDGLAAFALIVAAIVPLVNAISVAVLSRYGGQKSLTPGRVLVRVLTNPLILACAVGAFANVTGVGLPFGLGELLRMLAQPALPVGLLVVGAGLRAGVLAQVSLPVVLPTASRLVVYPLLALGAGYALGLDSAHLGPLLLFAALPTAASAYVLAVELGGDAELMARIITVETVACAASLPVWLSLL